MSKPCNGDTATLAAGDTELAAAGVLAVGRKAARAAAGLDVERSRPGCTTTGTALVSAVALDTARKTAAVTAATGSGAAETSLGVAAWVSGDTLALGVAFSTGRALVVAPTLGPTEVDAPAVLVEDAAPLWAVSAQATPEPVARAAPTPTVSAPTPSQEYG